MNRLENIICGYFPPVEGHFGAPKLINFFSQDSMTLGSLWLSCWQKQET